MKVCLISGEYPPMQGGVGDYTRELACALAELDVEIHVVTSAKAAGGRWESRDEKGVDAPRVHPGVARWNWRSLTVIQRLLNDVDPDIVHIQYQTAAYGMHPAINFLPLWLRYCRPDLRTAITYHDLRVPYLFPKAGRLRWWITLAPACWSHAVIVTNAEDRWRLESGDWRQSPLSNLQSPLLIPIGSNIRPNPPAGFDRQAWRARLGVGDHETLLAYFGFLNASKGGETLIRALDCLRRQRYHCRLLMVGGRVGASDPTNRTYLAQVERLIEELQLSDRVLWTGFVPDAEVSAALLSADMAVLPYRDGASFRRGSLMAVLAHGLPVVTTQPPETRSAGGLPQLVDGVNARLVPPDDPDALARAATDLIDDPIRRWQLGLFARQLSQAFTWDKIAAQTRAIYEQVL